MSLDGFREQAFATALSPACEDRAIQLNPPSDTNQQLDFRGCCAANCATAMGIQNTRLGEFGVADEMGFRILRTYRSR